MIRNASRWLSGLRAGAATILVVIVATLSLVANIIQVGDSIPAWAAIGTVAVIATLIYLLARPILQRNLRGVWLFNSVRLTGLVDVENRQALGHRLPPEQLFSLRRIQTIMISGVLDQLFQRHRDDVIEFVRRGGRAHVLLLHPERVRESLDFAWARYDDDWRTYWTTNCNEAQVAVDGILEARLDREQGFQVRFMCELPPNLGILALDSHSLNEAGKGSFIRVQPLTFSKWIGRGTVMTFKKTGRNSANPFEYFSEDLYEQWRVAAIDDEYISRRRCELGIGQ